mmetsp:Transcript_9766/g.14673  ORF Transcript_9766/g.14673 Transcript_9766/m.14673 type:complete len:84 (+) Transcript_9766:2041-2292(+)
MILFTKLQTNAAFLTSAIVYASRLAHSAMNILTSMSMRNNHDNVSSVLLTTSRTSVPGFKYAIFTPCKSSSGSSIQINMEPHS